MKRSQIDELVGLRFIERPEKGVLGANCVPCRGIKIFWIKIVKFIYMYMITNGIGSGFGNRTSTFLCNLFNFSVIRCHAMGACGVLEMKAPMALAESGLQ